MAIGSQASPQSPAEQRPLPVVERLYPEARVVGFTHHDQHITFYSKVNALLRPEMTVLDFGAGRGGVVEWPFRFKRELMTLRGKCARIVGYDLDPVVAQNPLLDEAVIGTPGQPLPFADATFDLIVSRATFEHVEAPEACAAELARVLKPGGWLCAWTPNRWGIVAIGGRLVPNRLHATVLKRLQPARKEHDVFPTVYRMNTLGALARLFPAPAFRHFSYTFSGPPTYHGNRVWLAWLLRAYNALTPGVARESLHVFIQKAA